MASLSDWQVSAGLQPKPEDYDFDLDAALGSMVALRSTVPADAFTADTLGTERAGNGVIIRDGVVLTIGYLITEADSIWLHLGDGLRRHDGVPLDQETDPGAQPEGLRHGCCACERDERIEDMAPMWRLLISRPWRTEVRGEWHAPVHRDMGELGDPQRLKATGLYCARQLIDADRRLRDSNEDAKVHV